MTPGSNNQFSGSVSVHTQAGTATGMLVRANMMLNAGASKGSLTNLVSFPVIQLNSASVDNSLSILTTQNIHPIGRMANDFVIGGRSAYGELGTINAPNNSVPNPFYLSSSIARTNLIASINALSAGTQINAVAAVPVYNHSPAPYIIFPGDNLVLSISKCRPFIYEFNEPPQFVSGSRAHDIKLAAGNIGITLYGSYVRADTTVAVIPPRLHLTGTLMCDVIGNDPVIDQYDVSYRGEYAGGMSDDVNFGSMFERTPFKIFGIIGLLPANRFRVFSKFNARTAPTLNTLSFPLQSQRSQPVFELAGLPLFINATCDNERYFDSMMPNLKDMVRRNNGDMMLNLDPSLLVGEFGTGTDILMVSGSAALILDYITDPDAIDPGFSARFDKKLTKSYPYEPRYARISRVKQLLKSFTVSLKNNTAGFGGQPPLAISPREITNLYVYTSPPPERFVQTFTGAQLMTSSMYFSILTDFATFSAITPTSLTATEIDLTKTLFGIGDKNTIVENSVVPGNSFSGSIGTTQWFDFRTKRVQNIFLNVGLNNFGHEHVVSPIVRGWKYGVYSGLEQKSRAVFRRNRYGQIRDMLEQREYTSFTNTNVNFRSDIVNYPVSVKFVDYDGNITPPERTQSQNLSQNATSSMPYFDGETRNRPPIIQNQQNSQFVSIKTDANGNISL